MSESGQVPDVVVSLLVDAQWPSLPGTSAAETSLTKLGRNLSPVPGSVNRGCLTWRPHLTSPHCGEGLEAYSRRSRAISAKLSTYLCTSSTECWTDSVQFSSAPGAIRTPRLHW